MAKFSAVTERMNQERQKDADAADAMMNKLNAHAGKREQVVAKGHDWIKSELEDEIKAMDDGLTHFANSIPPQEGGDGDASPKS
jgi:hypothetical protein